METCGLDITPEDFFRLIVRTNGTDFALAVNDLTEEGVWTSPLECPDGLTWQDILMLVYNEAKKAQNVIIV